MKKEESVKVEESPVPVEKLPPGAARQPDGSVLVRLRKPVTSGRETLKEVLLRGEATVADLEVIDDGKGEIGKMVLLLAELSGLGTAVIRRLLPRDYVTLSSVAEIIMGNDPSITGGSS